MLSLPVVYFRRRSQVARLALSESFAAEILRWIDGVRPRQEHEVGCLPQKGARGWEKEPYLGGVNRPVRNATLAEVPSEAAQHR